MNKSTNRKATLRDTAGARRGILKTLALMSALPLGMSHAIAGNAGTAADYPNKPIRQVHAFSAGSGTDTTGRILADGLAKVLAQPVIVENKPGASMMIGTSYAAKQPADGYTLAMVTLDSLGLNPFLYSNISYKVSDFDPITLVGEIPLVLYGPSSLPYGSFEELLKASAQGKQFLLGTWGHGSVGHVVAALIAEQTKIAFDYVPFQGAAPATQAAIGGHVDLALSTPQAAIEFVKSGRAKAFAVGGDARLAELPDVPTFKELGYPDIKAMQWHGLAARAGGNRDIINKLYESTLEIFKNPAMAEKLLQVGYVKIDGRTPEAFTGYIAAGSETWGPVVKNSIAPAN
jgi:tripartite-type tricarboxylate transporter receptor subunit TctC